MKSLPNDAFPLHKKKSFQKMQMINMPFHSIPSDVEIPSPNLFILTKKIQNLKLVSPSSNRRATNVLHLFIESKNSTSTLFFCLRHFILPNFFGFLLVYLLMKIENDLKLFDCIPDMMNLNLYIYCSTREILTNNVLYIYAMHLCFFDCTANIKNTTTKFILNISSMVLIVLISALFNYLKLSNNGLEIYLIPFICQIIFFLALSQYFEIDKKRRNKKILVGSVLYLIIALDHYFVRRIIIVEFHNSIKGIPFEKVIFQCFLFISHQIFGKILLEFLSKIYSENKKKTLISKNLCLLMVKYYIGDVICSCLVMPIIRGNGDLETCFGFLNYYYQLITLYHQRSFILRLCCRVYNYIFTKMNEKRKDSHKRDDHGLKQIIAGSTNEIANACILSILLIFIYKKTIMFPYYDFGKMKKNDYCKENLEKGFSIGMEYLLFLSAINIFSFLYFILKMKDKKKVKFLWKMEDYGIIMKSLFVLMVICNIDVDFQYYVYLNLVDKQ